MWSRRWPLLCQSLVILACLCVVVSMLFPLPCVAQSIQMTFTLQTDKAPWPARSAASVEQLPLPLVFRNDSTGVNINWPAGAFIMMGGYVPPYRSYVNDAWASSDHGSTWTWLSGSRGNSPASPYFTYPTLCCGGSAVDSQNRLFQISGFYWSYGASNDVWMSTNGGGTWSQVAVPANSTGRFGPGFYPAVAVDSGDRLYRIGGTDNGNGVWRSLTQGRTWQRLANYPVSAIGGRLLHHTSTALANKDVLTHLGQNREIYVSTDQAESWLLLTRQAPWASRYMFNAEMTRAGVMVISGGDQGQRDPSDPSATGYLNDVWISLDGGWTWGRCAADAAFTDRNHHMTLLDEQGFFYVMGGSTRGNGEDSSNDVWRSSFSLLDLQAITKSCQGIPVPACGPGLTCLPGDSQTRFENGRVTCPAIDACDVNNLGFRMITANAQFAGRHSAGLELFKTRLVTRINGLSYTIQPNSFVLFGGVGGFGANSSLYSDIWISSDGVSWTLANNEAGFTPAFGSGFAVDTKSRLYKMGGIVMTGSTTGDVYISTNAGITWTKQSPSSSQRALPPRAFAAVYVDSRDALYAVGGFANQAGLTDVWRSADQGANWYNQGGLPFSSPPLGRFGGVLLISTSTLMQRDIMTYMGGMSRVAGSNLTTFYNDIWVSSNTGKTWARIHEKAPWVTRSNFQAEVTNEGLIVLTSGFNNVEALNDIWISADGGWSWGQCLKEASFSDRALPQTVLDKDGYLLLLGGQEYRGGNASSGNIIWSAVNDVWRSTLTFTVTNKQKLQKACGIQFPQCITGMSCLPGVSNTKYTVDSVTGKGKVTCPLLAECVIPSPDNGDNGNGGDGSTDSSSGNGNGSSSGSSGLSTGAAALIALLVLAAVAGVGGYCYYRHQQEVKASTKPLSTSIDMTDLLGEKTTSSDSSGSSSRATSQMLLPV